MKVNGEITMKGEVSCPDKDWSIEDPVIQFLEASRILLADDERGYYLKIEGLILDSRKSPSFLSSAGETKYSKGSESLPTDVKFNAFIRYFELLKIKEPQVADKVVQEVINGMRSAYNEKRLAAIELFPVVADGKGYSVLIEELEKALPVDGWFNDKQLNAMVAGRHEEADYLKDISVITAGRGDIKLAYDLIARANLLRPHGPVISNLKSRFNHLLLLNNVDFIEDLGEHNEIVIDETVQRVGGFKIKIMGSNNRLVIGAGTSLRTGLIEFTHSNSEISIGERCIISGKFRCRADATNIQIGNETTMMGSFITLHEKGTVSIGVDCMFSGDVRMDVSDMHSILDAETMQRINPPEDICIDDHVWLGQGVQILKGSHIASNSIVGAQAVVCSDIPSGSLAVGVPAKVIREGATWDRRRLPV